MACLALSLGTIAPGCATRAAPGAVPAQPGAALPRPAPSDGLCWYDATHLPVEGQGWKDTESRYDRLPARAKGKVRDMVWTLSRHSAGLYMRFVTDAREISFRWRLPQEHLRIEHMPLTGASGLDLYARDGQEWRWVGLARPTRRGENTQRVVIKIPEVRHEYRLYLPLYDTPESLEIGVNPEANVEYAPEDTESRRAPLVFYGTSITHGASASRPGMDYPAILGRRLHRPAINLGFSSNGTMDAEMAELIAEIDAAVFVIDCLPNMDEKMVAERTALLVRRLRQAHPDTPIVLVEGIEPRNAWFLPHLRLITEANNAALRVEYRALRAEGMRRLHYVENTHLLGNSTETAVDGIHPTDWGFQCYADALETALRKALRETPRP